MAKLRPDPGWREPTGNTIPNALLV